MKNKYEKNARKNVKKLVALALTALLAVGLTACGGEKDNNAGTVEIADAAEILTTVWNQYEEDDMFPVYGGDREHADMEGPATFDITNAEELAFSLTFPEDAVSKLDDAASMIHMMNANTFTAGAYHVVDVADLSALTENMKETVMNKRWMCGFPEKLIIVQVSDNYLVSAYGNGEMIETFKTKLLSAYDGATEVLVEANIE